MNAKPIKNFPASIHHRLLNLARARGEGFQIVLNRFVTERFLYRLSITEYRQQFVLKGAALFSLWWKQPHRSTKDIDLLATGDTSLDVTENTFRAICSAMVEDDGLVFDADTLVLEDIREKQECGGIRVTMDVFLGKARVPLQVDVGFGDAVTPRAVNAEFGGLLSLPPAKIRTYPPESVVAEKLQAMVLLDMFNSRMKDFYDMYILSRELAFDGPVLCKAISATFDRRKTAIPSRRPVALTREFSENAEKQAQWAGFVRKSQLSAPSAGLADVCTALADFLMPPLIAAGNKAPLCLIWQPGGPWMNKSDG